MSNFDEIIDYNEMFSKLESRGVMLSAQQKEQVTQIGHTNAKRWGNAGIGSSFGAAATNLVYKIFAFFQNMVSGFSFKNISDSFSNVTEKTGDQSEADRMHQMNMYIYKDLVIKKVVSADIATMITGEKLTTGLDVSAPELVDGSIPAQLQAKAGVNLNINTSLNRKGRVNS